MTCIVTFNVGGKIYCVSQALLNQHPDSMLAKLASNYDQDTSEPIFIERDSERFRHVLDYMRDGKIYVSNSNDDAEEAIMNDLTYLGFETLNPLLPTEDLKSIRGVRCHQIIWDVSRAATSLGFEDNYTTVKKDSSVNSCDSVLGTVGFTSGIHYWDIKILESDPTDDIRIGVTSNLNAAVWNFPGLGKDKGVNYFARDGSRFHSDKKTSFGPSYTVGDVIGVLLNMNHRTVTFYKNGVRVGIAAGLDVLVDGIYYPCVSLNKLGHKVSSCKVLP